MSFEGRYQKLCANGHYDEQDVYMETSHCDICGKEWVKSNLVDDTNEPGEGYDESMVPAMSAPKSSGIKLKVLSPNAIIPRYQTAGASGFDLHSAVDEVIMPGETKLIDTGLAFAIPEGLELQIRPRSGISAKTGIRVANAPGTVDSDFRDSVKIILTNTGQLPYTVKVGDRMAQGVLCPVVRQPFTIVDDLDETERGTGAFGSTGV